MMRMAGVIVAVAAFSVACLARVQLGKAFAFTPQAKGLVTKGLYSRFKHPMYIFGATLVGSVATSSPSADADSEQPQRA